MPKLSQYNHFQRWVDGYYIAYNAMSGAVALMTDENFGVFQRLARSFGNGFDITTRSTEEQDLFKQLRYGQFVVDDSLDEKKLIRFRHHAGRYDTSGLSLTIAPTMACNMACSYCYEGNKKGKMSQDVIESIVEFAKQRAVQLKVLDSTWYGGEPLLAMDVIEKLSRPFQDIAKEHKFRYQSTIITNGYLLAREVVDRLVDLNVYFAQVTLDGPARTHNLKRPLKNKKESFGTIIENLKYASTRMYIGIRVNVDLSFDDTMILELLDEFERAGIHKRIGVSFAQLHPASDVCANIVEHCYDTENFAGVESRYYGYLLERGMRVDNIPAPTSAACLAQLINSFVIDPDGNLYRCYNYVGDAKHSTGNIKNEPDYTHENFHRLFDFDPTEDETCLACGMLPVCMGGCPARRADSYLYGGDYSCQPWKHNLSSMLEIIARSRQQQKQSVQKEQQS